MKKTLRTILILMTAACLVLALAAPAFANPFASIAEALQNGAGDTDEEEIKEEEEGGFAWEEVPQDEAEYLHTQQFLAAMDEMDIGDDIIFYGQDDDGDEVAELEDFFETEDGDTWDYTMTFFFAEDESDFSLRIWNLIDFDEADLDAVIDLCNDINYNYRFMKFYVDKTDNSVTASMDLLLDEEQDFTSQASYVVLLTEWLLDDVGSSLLEYAA